MLRDIEPQYSTVHIGGREYNARYSLNALLYLEDNGRPIEQLLSKDKVWSIEDVLHLVRAGMVESRQNKKAVVGRDWERIEPSIATLEAEIEPQDMLSVKLEIIRAIEQSMPEPIVGLQSDDKELDIVGIRTVYVDIMGRPIVELWTSTLREITDRTDAYFRAKGLTKPVQEVQMYEDE